MDGQGGLFQHPHSHIWTGMSMSERKGEQVRDLPVNLLEGKSHRRALQGAAPP